MPDNLDRLEAESIEIFREVFAQFAKPVLLYSIGKDSSVLLHLALKACHPAPLPFPLLHIDTGWKFRAMIAFRDETARRHGVELIVHTNEEGRRKGVVPFGPGASHYTDIMKTEALRAALELHAFDAAIGGARRDEEASRAKERIFSVRQRGYRWSPERQRPELWRIYNGRLDPGQTMRVFPLSNWTEGDVWSYIRRESIPVVDLYLAKPRPVVARGGMLIMRDDERMPLEPGEAVETKMVRFRTLGCYPLTGAVESAAESIDDVLAELSASRFSERQARQIDKDGPAAMERKKVEGYF